MWIWILLLFTRVTSSIGSRNIRLRSRAERGLINTHMATPPIDSAGSRHRTSLGIVFLVLFVDLIGFSIVFPLFPAMLDHYAATGWLH